MTTDRQIVREEIRRVLVAMRTDAPYLTCHDVDDAIAALDKATAEGATAWMQPNRNTGDGAGGAGLSGVDQRSNPGSYGVGLTGPIRPEQPAPPSSNPDALAVADRLRAAVRGYLDYGIRSVCGDALSEAALAAVDLLDRLGGLAGLPDAQRVSDTAWAVRIERERDQARQDLREERAATDQIRRLFGTVSGPMCPLCMADTPASHKGRHQNSVDAQHWVGWIDARRASQKEQAK